MTIKIEDWTNTAECDFKYVAEGHHDPEAFLAAVRAHEAEQDADPLDPEYITARHRWFLIDGKTGQAKHVPEGTPGAVAYTETDWF